MMAKKPDRIKIYTDGGCDRNPGGTGGWAFRLMDGDRAIERSGSAARSTNNRMELTAAIRALEMLDEFVPAAESAEVEILTDSQYLARGMNEWIANWVRRNWALRDGSPVKNTDLWKQLLALANRHQVTWTWVQGHSDDPDNLRVDRLVQKVISHRSQQQAAKIISAPAEVKLVKQRGEPISVTIAQKGVSAKVSVGWAHLQKLIEDLVAALREGEES